MLLYLAGQCAYFSTHFPPIGALALGGISRVLADGSFLEFLNLGIDVIVSPSVRVYAGGGSANGRTRMWH